MKKPLLFFLTIAFSLTAFSQEILCNIQVNSSQVQTSDRKIYQTMQIKITKK